MSESSTTELPGAGTSQLSGASHAAAAGSAEAAPQSAATTLYQTEPSPAAQPHASEGAEPGARDAPEPHDAAGREATARDESGGEGEEGAEADSGAGAQAAPEHYEFQPVEGVHLSDEVLGTFSEVARELNLSQEAAQKMLDRVGPAMAQQQRSALHTLSEQWLTDTRADREIGGDKLDANIAIARKARNAFGSESLRTLLNETRLGNHPEVIKFFVKVGKAISEDAFVPGGTRPPSGGRDAAAVLYGRQTQRS